MRIDCSKCLPLAAPALFAVLVVVTDVANAVDGPAASEVAQATAAETTAGAAATPDISSAPEAAGVSVPDGFRATLFADDDLAHDIYCMTIDSLGRVVVSGRGYVRTLIDDNGDGRADRFQTFTDGPDSGAQGMYFFGRDLLCIGDNALLRYRDADGDGRADGPPDRFLDLKAGGEHDVHSIQKGPDGWWYLIAGNYSGINSRYATTETSPLKNPRAGVVFRLKPDLTGGEIVAHGFRNAYDFAFNSQGDLFTFDSDGEREISLPWYRPTRVFQVLTGGDAGWVTRNWKQPDDFLDMPPVLAEFGRGSPTGVVTYRHAQFPASYHDSLFVLDWTYGRVMNLQLRPEGSSYATQSRPFMTGVGQHGFAPTDVEVARDGSLLVCVGGRGTRGGVYRVLTDDAASLQELTGTASDAWPGSLETVPQQVSACLVAPQPLASWSRNVWEPIARRVGADEFRAIAVAADRPAPQRIRAIEILVNLFDGLNEDALLLLAADESPAIRARTAWAIGRTRPAADLPRLITPFLHDASPLVGRIACEALLGLPGELSSDESSERSLAKGLAVRMGSDDRFDRVAAARVAPQLNTAAFAELARSATAHGWRGGIGIAVSYVGRKPGYNAYAFDIGLRILERDLPVDLKRDAVRLMQLGLGDLTPEGKVPEVFEGYASAIDLTDVDRELDAHRIRLQALFPTGDEQLDDELARLLAMLQPFNADLLTKLLAQITDESHPTRDVHHLIVAARIPVARDEDQRQAIARSLLRIEPKLKRRELHIDSSWQDRIGELYTALANQDELLPETLVMQPEFGLPGHVQFMSRIPKEAVQDAVDAFRRQVAADEAYAWSNDVVFVFGESDREGDRELVRDQYENFSVRNGVLMVLAAHPEERDRGWFVEGLESGQIEVLESCVDALAALPESADGAELVALVRCLRRLGTEKDEVPVREKVVRLLQRNSGQNFGFDFENSADPQQDAIAAWTTWVIEQHADAAAILTAGAGADAVAVKERLAEVDWSLGDAARGKMVFEKRSCTQCHGGRQALGPDLSGVAARFSRDDLFTAIVDPNRDVSSRYQTTLVETKGGRIFTGLVIYESTDGLILRNATNQTWRIETRDIEMKRRLPRSLMPVGLLKDTTDQDLADLYAWLQTLQK